MQKFDAKNWFKNIIKPKKKPKVKKTFTQELVSWGKTLLWAVIVVMFINGAILASFVVPTGSMEDTVMPGDFLFVNKFIYGPSTPQIIPFINQPLPFYKFPGFKDPKQGDVIVFIFPGEQNEVKPSKFEYYLKRCVASAGDTIQVINKRLFVNRKEFSLPEHGKYDIAVPELYATFPGGNLWTKDNYGPIRIPKEGDVIKLTPANIMEWRIFIMREGHDVGTDGMNIYIDNKVTKQYVVKRDYCWGMGDNRDHSSDSRFWGFIPYDNVVGTPLFVYWSWDPGIKFIHLFDKLASLRLSRIFTIIR